MNKIKTHSSPLSPCLHLFDFENHSPSSPAAPPPIHERLQIFIIPPMHPLQKQ